MTYDNLPLSDLYAEDRWDRCTYCGHIRACHDPICIVDDCTGCEFVEPLPTLPEVLKRREAAGLADAGDMQRTMAEAREAIAQACHENGVTEFDWLRAADQHEDMLDWKFTQGDLSI